MGNQPSALWNSQPSQTITVPLLAEVERLGERDELQQLDDSSFKFPLSFVNKFSKSTSSKATKTQKFLPPPGKDSVVYRGRLPNKFLDLNDEVNLEGSSEVAIRRLQLGEHLGGKKSYLNEVSTLSKIPKHRNILPLLGYCAEGGEALLLYEYMALGNLKHALFEDDHLARVMPLSVRIQLGADIANGLAHLHENQVLHVDLRPANILLDKNFRGKIKGLKTSVEVVRGKPHLVHAQKIIGRIGYVCPSILETGHITPKSDVFSLGVIILQLLSGKLVYRSETTGQVVPLAAVLEAPEIGLVDSFGGENDFQRNNPAVAKLASNLAEKRRAASEEKALAEERKSSYLYSRTPKSDISGSETVEGSDGFSYKQLETIPVRDLEETSDAPRRYMAVEKVTSFEAFLDSRMEKNLGDSVTVAKRIALIGLLCLQDSPSLRPTAAQVAQDLENLLQTVF